MELNPQEENPLAIPLCSMCNNAVIFNQLAWSRPIATYDILAAGLQMHIGPLEWSCFLAEGFMVFNLQVLIISLWHLFVPHAPKNAHFMIVR